MRFFFHGLAAAILAFAAAQAKAQSRQQNIVHCNDQSKAAHSYSVDVRIAGCTGLIDSGRLDRRGLSVVLNLRGWAFLERRDYASAIADLDRAIRINPQFADAFNNRGIAYSRRQEYARAFVDLDEAIRLAPRAPQPYYNRGLAYRDSGDNRRAIADFDAAIRNDPLYADAWRSRGLTWRNLRDYDRALADANEAARLRPDSWGPPSDIAEIHLARRNYRDAIAYYTHAIALDPARAWNYARRGRAHERLNDRERALIDYREAVRLDPNGAEARTGLCRVLRATNPLSEEIRAACRGA